MSNYIYIYIYVYMQELSYRVGLSNIFQVTPKNIFLVFAPANVPAAAAAPELLRLRSGVLPPRRCSLV